MKSFDYDTLGPYIKKLRQEIGLTQTEVADALHVTPGYICNVENSRSAMSLRILTYYAQLLHISLDSLVGQIEPDYRASSLDNEIIRLLSKMSADEKQKLIQTLRIWMKE